MLITTTATTKRKLTLLSNNDAEDLLERALNISLLPPLNRNVISLQQRHIIEENKLDWDSCFMSSYNLRQIHNYIQLCYNITIR